jgi:hypothetical protein
MMSASGAFDEDTIEYDGVHAPNFEDGARDIQNQRSHRVGTVTTQAPGSGGNPLLSLYSLGSPNGRKNTMGRGGMVKRPRRYSDNGYSSGNGDSRTAHRRVGLQRRVEDNDFLDSNEDDNQQEIRRWRVNGILLAPAMLFRAQESCWRTAANGYQQCRRCSIGR